MFEVIRYRLASGKHPFDEWLRSLRDKVAQTRVLARMRQLEAGNLGDCAPLGEGILELRIHVGAGYRVYIARHGETMIILLCGGDKSSQNRDIEKAKSFWVDWKRRQLP